MSSPRDFEIINGNTDAQAEKVLDLLGVTDDSGGTATDGTAMAKLNNAIAALHAAADNGTEGTAAHWALHAWDRANLAAVMLQDVNCGLAALKNKRKICTASDAVLATIINAETTGLNNAEIEKRMLIVGFSGIVRLKYSIKSTAAAHNSVSIYKDNVYTDGSGAVQAASNTYAYTDYTTAYVDIPVKDGDILRFSLWTGSGGDSVYCNLLTVCGTVSDAAAAAVAL